MSKTVERVWDAPIKISQDDRFGRVAISSQIERTCLRCATETGRTIGVVGEWGSGKTSCLHMAEELLTKQTDVKVQVRWFNPWLWEDSDTLVKKLLLSVAGGVFQERWYARALSTVAQWGRFAGKWVPTTTPEGVVIGVAFEAVAQLAETQSATGQGSHHELQEAMEKAKRATRDSGIRTVVMVDDIDRLEPRQLAALLRAIRLVGDLPNVVYVLALDRRSVTASLSARGYQGGEYLEKIIETEIRVPTLQTEQREAMLWETVERLITGQRGEMSNEDRGLTADAVRALSTVLRTPRQVKRYLMSLEKALACTPAAIRPSDIVALEGVRLAMPKVERAIVSHTAGLTAHEQMPLSTAEKDLAGMAAQDAVLEAASADQKGTVRALVAQLFPRAARARQQAHRDHGADPGMTWRVEAAKWRREGRVAETSVLEAALGYRTTEDLKVGIAQKALLAKLDSPDDLRSYLREIDPSQLHAVLDVMTETSYRPKEEEAKAAIPVLMDALGDIERVRWREALSEGTERMFRQCVAKLLAVLQPEEDGRGLSRAVEQVSGIGSQARLLRWARECDKSGALVYKEPHVDRAEREWLGRLRNVSIASAGESVALCRAAVLAKEVAPRIGESWEVWDSAATTRQILVSAARESGGWTGGFSATGEDVGQTHRRLELDWRSLAAIWGEEPALAAALEKARSAEPKEWQEMGELGEVALEYLAGRGLERFNEFESQEVRVTFGEEIQKQIDRLRGEGESKEELCTRALREGHMDPSIGALRGLVPGSPPYRHSHSARGTVSLQQAKRAERISRDLGVDLPDVWRTTLAAGLDRMEARSERRGGNGEM